jgi:hypothetical protein
VSKPFVHPMSDAGCSSSLHIGVCEIFLVVQEILAPRPVLDAFYDGPGEGKDEPARYCNGHTHHVPRRLLPPSQLLHLHKEHSDISRCLLFPRNGWKVCRNVHHFTDATCATVNLFRSMASTCLTDILVHQDHLHL